MSAITLYSSPKSDCSARVRIALNLKNIQYQIKTVVLGDQQPPNDKYAAVNAAKTVPTLIHHRPMDKASVIITQSIAALEYIQETFPGLSLLPPVNQPEPRAVVRSLMSIIANDIHPLTTHRVRRAICQQFSGPAADIDNPAGDRAWMEYWISHGLAQYEAAVQHTVGIYSVGDEITLADVCLVPQVWTAMSLGMNISHYPIVKRIFDSLSCVSAFADAHQARDAEPT